LKERGYTPAEAEVLFPILRGRLLKHWALECLLVKSKFPILRGRLLKEIAREINASMICFQSLEGGY